MPAALAEHAIEEGRYAFIKLRRNIDDAPIETDPVVLCDARSVMPKDLAVFPPRYPRRVI